MTKSRLKTFWPALLIALLVLTAFTFAASSRRRRSKAAAVKVLTGQNQLSPASANRSSYIRRSLLSPQLVWNLSALGDRLERPGKERLSVTGTLTRPGDPQPAEVVALLEFPGRLHLTIQKGIQTRVITFDGELAKAVGSPLDFGEQDLIETLVYGTAERFFMTQMQGQATRFLGARFRIDEGASDKYSGPYYDIYQVADQIKTSTTQREQEKLYYFNSETLLLERVSYKINREGAEVKIEEMIGGWTKEQGQQVARRIERLENGKSAFVFAVRSAGLGSRLGDGVFTN
jgi:hypothetical protein